MSVLRRNKSGIRQEDGQAHSLLPAEDVVGREDDKKAVIESLLDYANAKENVSLLSIVGIGGLGKTIVAKLVFNDEQIKNYFELKLWVGVCVGQL